MKTNKAIQPSVAITLDDVIFSNRNQAYGAYYLRKKYNKHLLYALLLIIFLFGSGTTIPLLWQFIFPKTVDKPVPPPDHTVTIETTNVFTPPDPPAPKIDPSQSIVRSTLFPTYKVVDSLTKQDTALRNSLPTDPGLVTSNDTGRRNVIFVNVVDPYIPPTDSIFTHVEEPATFRGGDLNDFRIWVQQNINYPEEAVNADISGKVNVSFVVNKNGELSDINVIRCLHPSVDKEAVRVLLSSPKWKPAKQNGRVVKQLYSMQVKFVIN
jgi:periplasmic protein TonB